MAHSSVRPATRDSHHKATAEASPANICLLSNGRYTVMLTQAGSGYSTCDGLDVTRWREDATADCWGQFVYIRDLDGGGTAFADVARRPRSFTTDRTEFLGVYGAPEGACCSRAGAAVGPGR